MGNKQILPLTRDNIYLKLYASLESIPAELINIIVDYTGPYTDAKFLAQIKNINAQCMFPINDAEFGFVQRDDENEDNYNVFALNTTKITNKNSLNPQVKLTKLFQCSCPYRPPIWVPSSKNSNSSISDDGVFAVLTDESDSTILLIYKRVVQTSWETDDSSWVNNKQLNMMEPDSIIKLSDIDRFLNNPVMICTLSHRIIIFSAVSFWVGEEIDDEWTFKKNIMTLKHDGIFQDFPLYFYSSSDITVKLNTNRPSEPGVVLNNGSWSDQLFLSVYGKDCFYVTTIKEFDITFKENGSEHNESFSEWPIACSSDMKYVVTYDIQRNSSDSTLTIWKLMDTKIKRRNYQIIATLRVSYKINRQAVRFTNSHEFVFPGNYIVTEKSALYDYADIPSEMNILNIYDTWTNTIRVLSDLPGDIKEVLPMTSGSFAIRMLTKNLRNTIHIYQ